MLEEGRNERAHVADRELQVLPRLGQDLEFLLVDLRDAIQQEIDLLLLKNGSCFGLECKRVDAPRLTPSMQIALEDLQLDRLVVIYPGERYYPLGEKVTAVPLSSFGMGVSPEFLR